MEMIEYAREGNNMNIKENDYIYVFEHLNKLTEQRSIKENDNQESMFDIAIRHEYTSTGASQGTRVKILYIAHDKTVPQNRAKNGSNHTSQR
jgi:hypothetical protein